MKREKSTMSQYMSQAQVSNEPEAPDTSALKVCSDDQTNVFVTAALDTVGRLVELEFKHTIVPVFLLKILTLCIPFQQNLNKLTIQSCPISDKAICEISTFLPQSQITEICFDESPLPTCNYGLLLERQTQLKSLSLNRCCIDDSDCSDIVAKLAYPAPSCRSLTILSLASNFITDKGGLDISSMLRTNRSLRYLNLSGNHITDTGAFSIFSCLMKFPLTPEEINTKRVRNLQYLKSYREVYEKCYKDIITSFNEKAFDDRSGGRKRITQRRSTIAVAVTPGHGAVADAAFKAEAMTIDIIGRNDDPFSNNDTHYLNGYLYCNGNMSLAYLDMSFNKMSHLSIVKLVEVMRYQESSLRKSEYGLIRVVMDGNLLPAASVHLDQLQELIERATFRRLEGPLNKSEKKINRKR
ncbi:unnamed protein product [Leptosia nina]|uniref:Uncharacterized protein n=1 Tax=Leptosia nina TaxID=320188 RepID=A0AAV1JL22_9NEOP